MAMADEGRYYSEHDDRVGGPTFRTKKGRGPFRGRMHMDQLARPRHRGGASGLGPRARLEDDDGDVAMNDSSQDSAGAAARRYNPYGGRPNRRGDERYDRDRGGGNAGAYRPGRGGPPRKSWFKMTIPYGKKYEKTWLITALQNLCTVPFTPVQYHCEGNKAMFYIEDATTANALSKVSRKITDTDGYKVSVIMNPSPPPPSIQSELKTEDLEHMKQCMSKRFDAPQQALDLNSIRTDPDLLSHNIEVILNRKNCMQAVNKIIEENIPELVSLNLSNNRLYKLDDMAELVGRVPTLKILNLSHNEGSYFGSDEVKCLILHFLQQYYSVYDTADRQPLLDAYHDGASFSISIPNSSQNPSRSSLGDYLKDSRNIKRLKDPTMRFRLLKHTRLNVVAFLNELPKTQHDINCFVVDVNTYTNTLLSFTVSGVFKEVDGKSRDSVRAFSRAFIAVPAGNAG
ncbi:NXF1 factor, partial [Atractosteus spatula]|nr:NXF1 factor [Atractosteus spatula]